MSHYNLSQHCGEIHHPPIRSITMSLLFKFIILWFFFPQKVNCSCSKNHVVSLKETLSLPHKIPIGHPPNSGDIHFPLIVFSSSLPLETASSHSSSLAAVTLKETPNQNICLSFSQRSDRWMRADTTGRCIRPNRGLISASSPGECFISTGYLWICYLALIGGMAHDCQSARLNHSVGDSDTAVIGDTGILPLL